MIELGNYNTLKVLRSTGVGVFLGDEEGTEILLPNKYVPENIQQNEDLKVFCYLDSSERPVATTLKPYIVRNQFAFLKVAQVSDHGAFMDWGLEKHLLVPFREQHIKMESGKSYLVHCYLDEVTFRLVASSKLNRFLNNENHGLKVNDEVDLLIGRKTDLGWEVIIEQKYKGLIFFSDVFKPLEMGKQPKGYVKKVRSDNKIDISLQPLGHRMLEPTADFIYKKLIGANGFLPFHDKSSPESIKSEFELSKKAFKKAIGILYKERKIAIKDDGIHLIE